MTERTVKRMTSQAGESGELPKPKYSNFFGPDADENELEKDPPQHKAKHKTSATRNRSTTSKTRQASSVRSSTRRTCNNKVTVKATTKATVKATSYSQTTKGRLPVHSADKPKHKRTRQTPVRPRVVKQPLSKRKGIQQQASNSLAPVEDTIIPIPQTSSGGNAEDDTTSLSSYSSTIINDPSSSSVDENGAVEDTIVVASKALRVSKKRKHEGNTDVTKVASAQKSKKRCLAKKPKANHQHAIGVTDPSIIPKKVKKSRKPTIDKSISTPANSTSANRRKELTDKVASDSLPRKLVKLPLPSLKQGNSGEISADDLVLDLSEVDPQLLALSSRLEERKPLDEKPNPIGQPEVWADSRQALCETLPYFKRPQGGCYLNDGHVYGFLFDSIGHCREYMDPDVIICRAGGGMEMDTDGKIVQKKHQNMNDNQPRAISNDIKHKNPLVVICGNRNAQAPCKMPHQYCVLDWFRPIAVWSEKTIGKGKRRWNTVKYRLERLCTGRSTAWCTPEGYGITQDDRSLAGFLYTMTCTSCTTLYPQVYIIGWMCLNADCDEFWKINGKDVYCGKIPYNPAFLIHREQTWSVHDPSELQPAPLRPPLPKVSDTLGDNLSYINTRGICCPRCGRCNPRRLFKGWVCESPSCDFKLFPEHKPVLPKMLHTPWELAPSLVRNKYEEHLGVELESWYQYRHKVCKYTFRGIKGCFVHVAANSSVNQETGGPDDMLAGLQTEDMGLERRTFAVQKYNIGKEKVPIPAKDDPPLPTPPEEGKPVSLPVEELIEDVQVGLRSRKEEFEDGDLMTAFSMNFGMPYKFVASGASRPFEGAPKAVTGARARLNWAARMFLPNNHDEMEFNEELIFAYLQGQKIEYHDDGEDGLGPRIATISLGGRAQMYLRMKQKHFVGCSKGGVLVEEEPTPCSIGGPEMYARRKLAWDELQSVKHDRTIYNKRRKEMPHELEIFERRMKKCPDLVTITLSHGDIVLMEGYDIQKYMEHKIVPEGHLRFALTCRTILEDHLKPEERPAYTVLPETDEEKYHGPQTD